VYWAKNKIIVVSELNSYNSTTGISKTVTSLLAFYVSTASDESTKVVPMSVGTVPGSMIKSYSMDVVDQTILRVATSIRNWSPTTFEQTCTENYITILNMTYGTTETSPGIMSELSKLQLGEPNEVFDVSDLVIYRML
jgi:Beta propeller domain